MLWCEDMLMTRLAGGVERSVYNIWRYITKRVVDDGGGFVNHILQSFLSTIVGDESTLVRFDLGPELIVLPPVAPPRVWKRRFAKPLTNHSIKD